MTPVLFYGAPEGCSFGSIVALEWSGLAYRLCRIEMPSVVTSDAFRRINPAAETPALMTADGRVVSQSAAILHHIGAASTASALVPPVGTPAFDHFNQVLSFLNTNFFESFATLWYALEHGKEGPEKDALRSMGQQKVRKAHADLERMLDGAPWLAGESRTAADAYFAGIARWNDFHAVLDRSEFPALDALYQRLQQDPAVRFAHSVEHGEPAKGAGGFAGHMELGQVVAAG
ncbi:MAG: glutathione S-transferase family protein [Comamonadaceae bacterium]|nr:MAG: glutathione S-transferase family protein [Comamonadaceae bacterium]